MEIRKTEREKMSEILRDLRKIFPDASDRFLHALQSEPYDLWQKDFSEEKKAGHSL